MEPKTEEQIEQMIESYEELRDRIDVVMERLKEFHKGYAPDVESSEVSISPYSITFEWDEYRCSCCGPERQYLSIPTSYLWEDLDEIIEQKREEQRLEKQAEEEKKRAEKLAKEAKKRKDERDTYLKLKEKYERGEL